MRHDGLPLRLFSRPSSRPSLHPSPRRRTFAIFLPLVPLLLALVLAACGSGIHECGAAPSLPAPALATANGVVYAQGAGGFSALRADAGTPAWRSRSAYLAYNAIRSHLTPPVIADGVVIASIGFGTLIAHRLSDGSVAWHSQAVPRPLGGEGGLLPILKVASGVVYAAASHDTIAAWRVADGTLLWQSPPLLPTTDPMDQPSYPYTQVPEPVLAGNVVYFVAGKVVRAIRATDGSPLWSTPVLPTPDLSTETYYVPAVFADGRLYIVVAGGSLYALDATTGAVLWHALDPDMASNPNAYALAESFAPPVVRDGIVYYAPLDGIRAIDAATGHLRWRFPARYTCPPTSAPVIAGGVVYVTLQACLPSWHIDTGNALVALDAHTGAMRWIAGIQPGRGRSSATVGAGVTVLVQGNAVYTISSGTGEPNSTYAPGVVAAWNASKGARLWQRSIQLPSPDFQQVALADDTIYLGMPGEPGLPVGCGGIRVQPAIAALRATDGTLLWQTTLPVT